MTRSAINHCHDNKDIAYAAIKRSRCKGLNKNRHPSSAQWKSQQPSSNIREGWSFAEAVDEDVDGAAGAADGGNELCKLAKSRWWAIGHAESIETA